MRITAKSSMSSPITRRLTSQPAGRAARVFLALAACVAMLSGGIIPSSWASDSLSKPPIGAGTANVSSTSGRAGLSFGRLPVTFEENLGQADSGIRFISRAQDHSVLIGRGEATIIVRGNKSGATLAVNRPARKWNLTAGLPEIQAKPARSGETYSTGSKEAVVRTKLVGAAASPRFQGLEPAQGKINYFVGQNPATWRTGIPTYARVKESGVYPGVDLVYHGAEANPSQLEYDFVIAPGANPGAINMSFEGASGLRLDRGDLVLETPAGNIRQIAPTAYQPVGNARLAVASKYEIKGKGRRSAAFHLGTYDHSLPLVIDPALVYSTLFGGAAASDITAVAVDASGNAYLAGDADPTVLPPTPGAFGQTGLNRSGVRHQAGPDRNSHHLYEHIWRL
jgi:hypothetical protein